MSKLVLYMAPGSPPARSVLMLSHLLRLRLDHREVKLFRNEHKTVEYKKMNPMSTVPVLQDGDFILSESHAILKYLLSRYGAEHEERLYPSEAKARALVDQCMFFNSGYLFPRMATMVLSSLFGGAPLPTAKQLKPSIDEALEVVEAYLQRRRFIAGDRFTLADLSVGATTTATLLLTDLDRDRFPRLAEWVQELEAMTCFKKINAEGLLYLKTIMEKAREKHKLKNDT